MQIDWQALGRDIINWGEELGFNAVGIADTDLAEHREHLRKWLASNRHGEMSYMARHGEMRSEPGQLHEGTLSVICVRLDYLAPDPAPAALLADPNAAYISRYALGRDYHKVIRGRLRQLSRRIDEHLASKGHEGYSGRVVTDSAPLLEKALAEKAGLGWIAKNTLIVSETAGSWFFLGELLTNLPLAPDAAAVTPPANRCGSCTACIDVCPTGAIVAPYQLDARKCISYLTIELKGAIPEPLRAPLGNRIFGCDDCQLVCPWNKYAQPHEVDDFKPRHGLGTARLLELFCWTEDEFLQRTEGSAIRRTGYAGWLRNIAVALGNARPEGALLEQVQAALENRKGHSDLVDEHIDWAQSRLKAADGLKGGGQIMKA